MCTLDDVWRYTAIFYTYAKCGSKYCKIIIDSGSYMKAIFTQGSFYDSSYTRIASDPLQGGMGKLDLPFGYIKVCGSYRDGL